MAKKDPKVKPTKPTKEELHIKAHGKKVRAVALIAGRPLANVSTSGVALIAEELDVPGASTNARAVNEVAIRTILGVEAEGKPQ